MPWWIIRILHKFLRIKTPTQIGPTNLCRITWSEWCQILQLYKFRNVKCFTESVIKMQHLHYFIDHHQCTRLITKSKSKWSHHYIATLWAWTTQKDKQKIKIFICKNNDNRDIYLSCTWRGCQQCWAIPVNTNKLYQLNCHGLPFLYIQQIDRHTEGEEMGKNGVENLKRLI